MAKQFSLAPIVTEQRPRVDIADKVNKYLGVATQAVADFKEREELEKTQKVSKRLYDEKDAYRKRIEQATTSEEMKEAYTIYTANTEDAINNSDLSEKSILRFRGLQDRSLDYMSNRYKATLDKEGAEAYKNAVTDVATAFIDADPKTQKELYNEFLKAAPNFRVDKAKGAEEFTTALANSVIVSLGEDAKYSQVNQAHKDIMEVVQSDPANKNKPYVRNLDNIFSTLKNTFRAQELGVLKEELKDPLLTLKEKQGKIKKAKDDEILTDVQYKSQLEQVSNIEKRKDMNNHRAYTQTKLNDPTITDTEVRLLIEDPRNNYTDKEIETEYNKAKRARANYNRRLSIQNLDLLVKNPKSSPELKLEALRNMQDLGDPFLNNLVKEKIQNIETNILKEEVKNKMFEFNNSNLNLEERGGALISLKDRGLISEEEYNKRLSDLVSKDVKKNATVNRISKRELNLFLKTDAPLEERISRIIQSTHLTKDEKNSMIKIETKDVEESRKKELNRIIDEEARAFVSRDVRSRRDVQAIMRSTRPTEEKIETIRNSTLSNSEKESFYSIVFEKSAKEATDNLKKLDDEERVIYRNMLSDLRVRAEKGDYSTTVESYALTLASAYKEKAIPITEKRAFEQFKQRKELVETLITSGGDFTKLQKERFKGTPSFGGVSLVDNIIGGYKEENDWQGVMRSYNYAQTAKSFNYKVKGKDLKNLRVAWMFDQLENNKQVAMERFKTFLTNPQTVKTQDVEENLLALIEEDTLELPENADQYAIRGELSFVIRNLMTAGIYDVNNLNTYMEKAIEEDFISVNLPGIGTGEVYIHNEMFNTSDEYERTVKQLGNTLGRKDVVDIHNKPLPKGDIFFVYPVDYLRYKQNKEDVMWHVYYEDGRTSVVDNKLIESMK
jgi:hypothetical protein